MLSFCSSLLLVQSLCSVIWWWCPPLRTVPGHLPDCHCDTRLEKAFGRPRYTWLTVTRMIGSNSLRSVVAKSSIQSSRIELISSPLQHLRLSLLRFCWSYSLEFTAQQSAQSSCWARAVSTDSENPPVCLLLAFRWQCVRGVFMYSR